MGDIKVGDIVFLNSEPKIRMTVVYVGSEKLQGVRFNSLTQTFEYSIELPIQAVTLVKE
ncbi:hypothetical protein [Bacteroides cellulosilyticus]|uniref:hypothetical protein n=1 Tax=Bacteroides cellulosilyticus TaxID=246787 RepID=UPI001C37A461|nr:hypothetical protein [Bacteroides cellulosilyticus]MBV3635670.1 hypothetical protein [Bacteroides cellulosilyticus]MBV3662141.1 hypothetical protein [Bacteroides cellulosilyticus]MBV3684262.1 hypothetical protein [Bacteroides cellulosilyticus]MBV3692673.1 hypothetical protein [Bacteroides cellulosilyticus]MBV3706309.1 hypothetical protein [Bacteroides cellulosilyticus]